MSNAVAYLRRSRVDTRRPGTISHEEQLAAVTALAARHGDTALDVLEDWGRSGREEKLHLRDAFAELRARVKRGEVSAVYAYDVSRLGRSVVTLYQLMNECKAAGVPIRCASGYSPDISTAEGRLVFGNLTSMFQYLAESAQERSARRTEARKARGDKMGKPPYGYRIVDSQYVRNPDEDLAAVLAAYREAGNVGAAARLLNARKVPTRTGRAWSPSTVYQILERVDADGKLTESEGVPVRTRNARRGRPTRRVFRLTGLLVCPHDGATLTGQTSNRGAQVEYDCRRSRHLPDHPRPRSVSEKQLMDWIRAEGDRLAPPDLRIVLDDGEAIDLDELAAERERVALLFRKRVYNEAQLDEALAEIEAQERAARLRTTAGTVAEIPAVDWDAPPEALNAALRALWERVNLGPDLRPISADWRVPEWRS